MLVYLLIDTLDHGDYPAGIFSTLERAKSTAHAIRADTTRRPWDLLIVERIVDGEKTGRTWVLDADKTNWLSY